MFPTQTSRASERTRECVLTHLQVVLWVPVRVEDDAGVGGGQVDAQPPGPSAQQEDKAV